MAVFKQNFLLRPVEIIHAVLATLTKKRPSTRHGGAWGERRYSSYSFTSSALDRGEWSASRPGRALPPGKGPPVPIVQEAGWDPEPVWTQRLEEKSFASAGDRIRPLVHPVCSQTLYWMIYILFILYLQLKLLTYITRVLPCSECAACRTSSTEQREDNWR
jgi:hypothetical protein